MEAGFTCWADEYRKELLKREHGDVLAKTLMRWGSDSEVVLLQTVFASWSHFSACHHASAKQDELTMKTLLRWGCQMDQLMIEASFRAWADVYKKLATKRKHCEALMRTYLRLDEKKESEILTLAVQQWSMCSKFSHNDSVLNKALVCWAGDNAKVLLRVTLKAWADHRKLSAHARQCSSVLSRSLLLWGLQNDDLLLRTAVHFWATTCCMAEERRRGRKALAASLLGWGKDSTTLALYAHFQEWHLWSNETRTASLLRDSRSVLGKALQRWGHQSERQLLEATVSAWAQATRDRRKSSWHDALLGKTMMQWGAEDGLARVHEAFYEWRYALLRATSARAGDELEVRLRIQKSAMAKNLKRWGADCEELLAVSTLRAWRHAADLTACARRGRSGLDGALRRLGVGVDPALLLGLAWRAWAGGHKQRRLRSNVCRSMCMSSDGNDNLQRKLLFTSWKEAHGHRVVAEKCCKSFGAAFVRWDAETDDLLLHAAMHLWRNAAESTIVRDAHNEEILALKAKSNSVTWSMLTAWSGGDDASLVQALLHMWQEQTLRERENALRQKLILDKAQAQKLREGVASLQLSASDRLDAEHMARLWIRGCANEVLERRRSKAVNDFTKFAAAAERFRTLHDNQLSKLAIQLAMDAGRTSLRVCFGAWHGEARSAAAAKDLRLRLQTLRARLTNGIVGIALAAWAGQAISYLLQFAFVNWLLTSRDAKYNRDLGGVASQAERRRLAQRIAQRLLSDWLEKSTLSSARAALTAWHLEAESAKASVRAGEEHRRRLQALRGTLRFQAEGWFADATAGSLRLCFRAWHSAACIRYLEDENAQAKELADLLRQRRTDTISLLKESLDTTELLLRIMHMWHANTMLEREETSRLVMQEEHEVLDDARRSQMHFAMLLADAERTQLALQLVFAAWRSEGATGAKARTARYRLARAGGALDAASLKWDEAVAAIILRRLFTQWGRLAQETRGDKTFVKVACLTARREDAASVLGASQQKRLLQDLLAVWHCHTAVESALSNGNQLSDEQHQQLALLLLAGEQRAKEDLDRHGLSQDLLSALRDHTDHHDSKLDEMEREIELLQAQMVSARLKVEESYGVEEHVGALKDHCNAQNTHLVELENEIEMLHAILKQNGMVPADGIQI
eukprot:TRINITY_DN39587_c0_g1_i1.p1 TRINITY_DN39587_c0_g1~~TRINITY_DN39587_c0_g1_i1.p1  ORF type:complete len:1146 (+),score=290.00 TRINITY_DN39587_c0_g1_i1:1-3438(+)